MDAIIQLIAAAAWQLICRQEVQIIARNRLIAAIRAVLATSSTVTEQNAAIRQLCQIYDQRLAKEDRS
jgi:hypothetical protein